MGLKETIKGILVEKQHTKYKAELSEKEMSYEDWILKQEKEIRVDDFLSLNWQNCLKNEKIKKINDGRQYENEGLLSKNVLSVDAYEIWDKECKNSV